MKTRAVLSGLNRCFDRIIGGAAYLTGALAIVLMLIVTFDVIMGYFFRSPTTWASEISAYILVFTPFLAGAWILKKDQHVKLDFLMERLNERNKLILAIVLYIVMMVVCGIIFWFGIQSVMHHYLIKYRTPTLLMLPKWPLLMVIPFGFLLLFIENLRGLVNRVNRLRTFPEIGAGTTDMSQQT